MDSNPSNPNPNPDSDGFDSTPSGLSASQSISEKQVLELSNKLLALEKDNAKAAAENAIKAKFEKKAAEEIAKLGE